MLHRSIFRPVLFLAGFAIVTTSLALYAQDTPKRGRKYKAPPPTSRIEVTVLRDSNSKPIERAAVIFHLVGESGNMELKTNEDGKTVIDVLPIGSSMRLQIIARGFQTWGEDFKIDKPQMAIEIKMKRPTEQYSIYPNPKDAGKDQEPKDKPAQPDTPLGESKPQPK